MIKQLVKYHNGNYNVVLLSDGTKIRYNYGDPFKAEFPENIDLKMTNWCDIGCPFCHEKSSVNGKSVDLKKYTKFFKSLNAGTELAMGGGKISSILKDIENLLAFLKYSVGVFTNMTFNQHELEDDDTFNTIIRYAKDYLIVGIGVSYFGGDKGKEVLLKLRDIVESRLVVHTIAGVNTPKDYEWLAENGFKILILGYKDFGRGISYKTSATQEKLNWVENHLQFLSENCESVSFDCLATEQLHLKHHVSKHDWEKYYMGDDGKFTMYVDLVEGKYGTNSTSPYEERLDIPDSQNVTEMFKNILNK